MNKPEYRIFFLNVVRIIQTALLITCMVSCSKDDSNDVSYVEVNNNGHNYVDLGLSCYWATCNVGAYSPTEIGDLYAFGETETKSDYTNSNYVGGNADVAYLKWGGDWRIPTSSELEELIFNCEWTKRFVNGVQVETATGPNGNSIDLPYQSYLGEYGYYGCYWTSTSKSSSRAYALYFHDNELEFGNNMKYFGFLVRPVMTNPNYSGPGYSGGGSSSPDSGSEGYAPEVTGFDYTSTKNSIKVTFQTDSRPSSASIYYGENDANKSAGGVNIIGNSVTANVSGLKSGTKYYFKCVVKNSYGSTTSDGWPASTLY